MADFQFQPPDPGSGLYVVSPTPPGPVDLTTGYTYQLGQLGLGKLSNAVIIQSGTGAPRVIRLPNYPTNPIPSLNGTSTGIRQTYRDPRMALRQPEPTGNDGLLLHQGFDRASAVQKFSWKFGPDVGENINIPFVYRDDDKHFVLARVLERELLCPFKSLLLPGIYDGPKIQAFPLTDAEVKNWSMINDWHCDFRYGIQGFTTKDLMISMDDGLKFYNYIKFKAHIFKSNGENKESDYSKCGFVRFAEGLAAYTVLEDGTKVIPTFYFGEIAGMKIQILKDCWPLAYLKLCCRLQGVLRSVLQSNEITVLLLNDFKTYLSVESQRTIDESTWLTGAEIKKKYIKPISTAPSLASTVLQWTNKVSNESYFSTAGANHDVNITIAEPKAVIPVKVKEAPFGPIASSIRIPGIKIEPSSPGSGPKNGAK